MITHNEPDAKIILSDLIGYKVLEVERLSGGINNYVARCKLESGSAVVKKFNRDDSYRGSCFIAERRFLELANTRAIGFTPRLIGCNEREGIIIMENIEGGRYAEASMGDKRSLYQAAEFYRKMNEGIEARDAMVGIRAREGYLCISEHLENIRRRIGSLGTRNLVGERKDTADRILSELALEFENLIEDVGMEVRKGNINDCICADDLRISPGDFGYHNAIKTKRGPCFIDFEFSGWDDPAKTFTDFMLQPRVSIRYREKDLATEFGIKENTIRRLGVMRRVMQLKWVCIILGVLNGERLTAMINNNAALLGEPLIKERLALAERRLSLIRRE